MMPITMCVYSERTIKTEDGKLRLGEDAFPYVNSAGMFVADGMGGSAGVSVERFDSDSFDGAKLADLLCESLLPEETDDTKAIFRDYSQKNFSSLTTPEMRKAYQNQAGFRRKKSGYVGSHALGTAMVSYLIPMKANPPKTKEEWNETVKKLGNPSRPDSLFERYKRVIELLGSDCASTSISKIDYYGTTLSAVFFQEEEDSVNAVFLNAGDSRSYVWDSEGFRQAVDDQGRGGGMTSYFTLSGDREVMVDIQERAYRKPCVFFSMTDGVYGAFCAGSGFVSTPLYMEGVLMNTLSKSGTIKETAQTLQSLFAARNNDDSSSLVMAAFGYASEAKLRESAALRTRFLEDTYRLDERPDGFLLEDYEQEASCLSKEIMQEIQPVLKEAFSLKAVQNYCGEQFDASPALYDRYCREEWPLKEQMKERAKEQAGIVEMLEKVFQENCFDFIETDGVDLDLELRMKCRKLKEIKKKYDDARAKIDVNFGNAKKSIENVQDAIASLQKMENEHAQSVDLPDINDRESYTRWKDHSETTCRVLQNVLDLYTELNEAHEVLDGTEEDWTTRNKKLAKKMEENGQERITDKWLSASDPDAVVGETTIPAVRPAVVRALERYQGLREQIDQLNRDIDAARQVASRTYWSSQTLPDLESYYVNGLFQEDPAVMMKIQELLEGPKKQKLDELKGCFKEQREVFQSYLAEHLRDVSEDKRLDVERNGWM